MNALGGFRREFQSYKQYIFTAKAVSDERVPLGRAIPSDTVIYQGKQLACVPCSVTCIANFEAKECRAWQELFMSVGVIGEGTKPTEVLELARQKRWIKAYYEITNRDPDTLYSVLKTHPVIVGLPVHEIMWAGTSREKPLVYDGVRDYGHMCVLWDVTPAGDWVVVNFAKEHEQDWRILSKDYPFDVAYFATNAEKTPEKHRSGFLGSLAENARRFFSKHV